MSNKKIHNSPNLLQNELKNAVVHNLPAAPVSPMPGQLYYKNLGPDLGSLFLWNGDWVDLTKRVSIVGTLGTKAEFNAALSDGDFVFGGDISHTIGADTGEDVSMAPLEYLDILGGTGLSSVISKTASKVTITTSLDNTTVVPGSYGGAATATAIAVDQQGRITSISTTPISITASQINDIITSPSLAGASDTLLASSLAIKAYVQSLNVGQLVYQTGYDATIAPPTGVDVLKGFTYTVTNAGDGAGFFTVGMQAGDVIVAETDFPVTEADWTQVNKNIPDIVDAGETVKGVVQEATLVEATAGTAAGTTGARLFVNPSKLASLLGLKLDAGTYLGNASDFDSRINILEGLSNLETGFTGQAYALWSGTGFVYNVIYPSYYIQGVLYPSGTAEVTLNDSDPTNPRLDVIAVDATGAIKVTGAADASPFVPTINTDTQIQITTVLVNAAATVPVQASTDINVYKENAEWVGTSSLGGVNFATSVNPFQGTKSIDVPAYSNITMLFTAPAAIQATAFDVVTFAVRLKSSLSQNNNKITVSFFNGATRVSSTLIINDGQFNFKRTLVGAYQLITIPIGSFSFTSSTITKLEIGLTGSNSSGLYLDNIVLSRGVSSASPLPITITSINTDNGILNANVPNDTISIVGANGVVVSSFGKLITITQTNQDISGKVDKNANIVAGTNTKITYDAKGLITAGAPLDALDIPDLDQSQITGLVTDLGLKAPLASPTFTGTATLPSTTSIGNVSAAEIGYLDGVTSNIQSQINAKGVVSGTINYIPVFTAATTVGNSRLRDTGTYLGIGTTNAPTKDVTLGNQANREIGIEESSNTVKGRDLKVEAGRTINYVPNSNFNPLNQILRPYTQFAYAPDGSMYVSAFGLGKVFKRDAGTSTFVDVGFNFNQPSGVAVAPNGDVYVSALGYPMYVQYGGSGSWISLNAEVSHRSIAAAPNGDIYATMSGGDIWKRTGGVGVFAVLGQTSRSWEGIAAAPNGDIYAVVANGDIFKQAGGTGAFIALNQTARAWKDITVSPNGNIYAAANGDIYMQTNGAGIFNALGQGNKTWCGIESDADGNIYAAASNWYSVDDIYMQQNNGVGIVNLGGGTLKLAAGTGKGEGSSDWEAYTGQKTASGTDMQIETLRAKINNEGLMTLPSTTTAIIDADVTGKAVVTKEYLGDILGGVTSIAYREIPTGVINGVNDIYTLANEAISSTWIWLFVNGVGRDEFTYNPTTKEITIGFAPAIGSDIYVQYVSSLVSPSIGMDLAYVASPTGGGLNSNTGVDAVLPLADSTNAGLLKPAKFDVLEDTTGVNTGDQQLIFPVIETGTPLTLANEHNGRVVILTASTTITLPDGLVASFEVSIVTLPGAVLTMVLGGAVVLFNNAGLTMAEKLSFTLKNRLAANSYITSGNL